MSRQGIGMTSQRTRERLIQRLMDQGITRFEVLEAIRSVPGHAAYRLKHFKPRNTLVHQALYQSLPRSLGGHADALSAHAPAPA